MRIADFDFGKTKRGRGRSGVAVMARQRHLPTRSQLLNQNEVIFGQPTRWQLLSPIASRISPSRVSPIAYYRQLLLAYRQSRYATVWSCPAGSQQDTGRSSFILQTTYPRSSVTSTLAGPSGRRPPGIWRPPSPEPSPGSGGPDLAGSGGSLTRHGAGGGT